MKLSKALKVKNRLIAEVRTLHDRMRNNNSYDERNEPAYNSGEVSKELEIKIGDLVELKARISCANAPIYSAIFRMSELKGMIISRKGMPTKAGVFDGGGWGEEKPIRVTYKATLDQRRVDELQEGITAEIDKLQDQVDAHNASTDI